MYFKERDIQSDMTEASEAAILAFLASSPDVVIEDTYPWSESSHLDHLAVVGAIKSLLVEEYIQVEDLATSFYTLTEEGASILANGSQEIIVLKALEEVGTLSLSDLQSKVGNEIAKIGMGNCMKLKWVKKDGNNLVPIKKAEEVQDEVQLMLKKLDEAKYSPDALSDKVNEVICRFSIPESF